MQESERSKRCIDCISSICQSFRLYGFMVWVYVILYQFAYPIGISEGHNISIFIPIRTDVVGIFAFIISFVSDVLIRGIK